MSSLKPEIFALCKEVAAEFDGWAFSSDVFKYKALMHTEIVLRPGFNFYGSDNPSCSLNPCVYMNNKRVEKLHQLLLGVKPVWTSRVQFQVIRDQLKYYPKPMRGLGYIWKYRQPFFVEANGNTTPWMDSWIALDEAKAAISGMLRDGIALVERYSDVSNEENFLRNLPIRFEHLQGLSDDEYSGPNGVTLCVVKLLQGDFDFVEHYCSEDFKTNRPKRIDDLNKILVELPQLKQRYVDTGRVL